MYWKFASSAAAIASVVTLVLSLALSAGSALAQTAPRPAAAASPPATAAPPAAATSSEPDQTTANYGDWALRCVRTGEGAAATRACEVLQTLSVKGQQQPLARVAFGSPEKPEVLRLILMIAPAVSLEEVPRLILGAKGTAPAVTLAWRRCLPAGCFADAALTPAVLNQLKKSELMEMTVKDATGKPVSLSISTKGLAQALDALAKAVAPSR